jgi:hypothetical protein
MFLNEIIANGELSKGAARSHSNLLTLRRLRRRQ